MNPFNPAMLTLARESRGLTQTELGLRAQLPQGTVSKLESGALNLTEELVKTLDRILDYPESFFAQKDSIYPFGSSTFYHRKLQSVPAGILRRIEARVNIYRFHVTRLLRATDLDARCRFARYDLSEHGGAVEEIAQLIRSAWHLPRGPIHNLTAAIEDAGGIVIRFDFGTSQMFGLSEWTPPAPPIFFLNQHSDISADRDRFTLAHELGHVLLHAMPNPEMEKQANRFAGSFLMPEEDIRPHLISPIKLHTVARLKPYWKVAMAALMHRAHELDIINENQYTYLRIQLQNKGYRLREPAELDIPREQPSLLSEIIQAHVRDLGFGLTQIADMVNMRPVEFREYHDLNERERSGLKIVRKA
jgi:Zn-dependent peptidase ImmA (M78 family)/transcriptional regulator with XRE-family HTH domain